VENFVMGRYLVTFAEYDYFCEEHKPDNNIVFLLKLNGSMQLELVLKLIIGGVMILMKLRLIIIKILVILPLWDIINLILLVCMIRLAMSGSGHVPNLQIDIMAKKNSVLQKQAALFCGVVRGTTDRGTCARLSAAGTGRLTATGTSGSGWSGSLPFDL
jgi:hypothetical protein